jgi:hypothetical protein
MQSTTYHHSGMMGPIKTTINPSSKLKQDPANPIEFNDIVCLIYPALTARNPASHGGKNIKPPSGR